MVVSVKQKTFSASTYGQLEFAESSRALRAEKALWLRSWFQVLGSQHDLVRIFHVNIAPSQRFPFSTNLMEELEIPYEIKKYNRTAQLRAPRELLNISPLGKSPVITDDNVTLAESGAIIEYLISKYGNGRFRPMEAGYLDNLYYMHYAEGSLMPILVQKLIFDMTPAQWPFFIRPLVSMIFTQLENQLLLPEIQKHTNMIESHLGTVQAGWFAGGEEPTAADFQMHFPLEALVSRVSSFATPRMMGYVKQVQDRPAYKRALRKGGGYSYAML